MVVSVPSPLSNTDLDPARIEAFIWAFIDTKLGHGWENFFLFLYHTPVQHLVSLGASKTAAGPRHSRCRPALE